MTGRGLRNRGVLFGVLALSSVALFSGSPSIATAETKTKVVTVPAEVVAFAKVNPTRPGNCGAASFVEWGDPRLKAWETEVAWTAFYTHLPSGEERSISGTPPFHDRVTHAGAVYEVFGLSHWLNISSGSKDGPTPDPLACEDKKGKMLETYGSPARTEITIEVGVDPAACTAAKRKAKKAGKKAYEIREQLRRLPDGSTSMKAKLLKGSIKPRGSRPPRSRQRKRPANDGYLSNLICSLRE